MTDAFGDQLPFSWALERLDAIADINPRLDKSEIEDRLEVSFVPMPAVEAGTGGIDVSQVRLFGEVKRGYTPFREGDVLFAKITPCMENGKMAIAPALRNGYGFGSTEFHIIRPLDAISARFVYYLISSQRFRLNAEHNMTGAVGQRRVPTTYLSEHLIPVPPSREQHRIVAKIEELLSELDKGVESLQTVRDQLQVYRQAVLKHAFNGKLTAGWRAENKDKLETPDQLLERVRKEREIRYKRQLEEWQDSVRNWESQGKATNKPAKPQIPPPIERLSGDATTDLPTLPPNWLWLRLEHVSDISGGLTKNQKRNTLPKRMKYLRVANVYADEVLTDEVYEIGVTDEEARKVALEQGDLLIVEGNGSVDQIGRVAMWGGEIPDCGHQNHLIRARLATNSNPRFFLQFMLSPLGRDLIMKEASSTSGLHTLSITKVSNLIVPVVPPAEEAVIVQQIEEKLSNVDKLLEEIDIQLVRADALRQSILKQAFSGQLVEQDSKEEPASILLGRINADRGARSDGNKTNNRKKAA